MTEKRRESVYKALLVLVCGMSGSAGGWGGSKISQAELQRMIEAQGQMLRKVEIDVEALKERKVDRMENAAADAAQDKRVDDIKTEILSLHADVRTLIEMQARDRR